LYAEREEPRGVGGGRDGEKDGKVGVLLGGLEKDLGLGESVESGVGEGEWRARGPDFGARRKVDVAEVLMFGGGGPWVDRESGGISGHCADAKKPAPRCGCTP